jgi:hypothetical protein
MLDDETLKEVGLFAIEFSTLDKLIATLATAILECTEWNIAQYLTERLTDGRKLEQIEAVSKKLANAHGLLDADVHKVLLEQIGLAKGIVDERNTVIHGEVTIDQGNRPVIQLKKQAVEVSPRALSELVEKIDRVAYGLITAYVDFMDAVYKARTAGG